MSSSGRNRNTRNRQRRSRNRSGLPRNVLRDMAIRANEVVDQTSGMRLIVRRATCSGNAIAYKTDSTGTVSGTSNPVNGVLQLAVGLFPTLPTLVDMIRYLEWGFIITPTSNNSGTSLFWIDWDDTTNATEQLGLQKHARVLSNSNTSATAFPIVICSKVPKAAPYTEIVNPSAALQYTASLKWYTDATHYGSGDSIFEFTVIPFFVYDGYGFT